MAETAAAAIASALAEGGYATAAAWVAEYGAVAIQVAATAASVYTAREQQRRAQAASRAQYEASLKDRYVMMRSTTAPRQVVLGRQRVSGPVAYIGSYGSNREHLVLAVVLAAHEIDAIEAVYFDDERVTLDGAGNVTSVARRDVFSISAATGTFTLTSEPAAGSVVASVAYGSTVVPLTVTGISGTQVSVSGASVATGTLTIQYAPAQSPWVVAAQNDLSAPLTLDAAGRGTITLPLDPAAGSVSVLAPGLDPGSSYDVTQAGGTVSVAGAVVTVDCAAAANVGVTVRYRDQAYTSRARVRKYTGAAGQTADAGMVAALPGVWTSAHRMTGLAYVVVELDYDPDAFPGGLPNVSALVRGAKLYDPRTGSTAWSENPALMMRYVATSSLLGRLPASAVNDAAVVVAANACDRVVPYSVNGQIYNRPLYAAGLVANAGMRAKDVLDDLAKAMAGRWCFVDGQLRVRAGAYVLPLQTLTDDWLHNGGGVQVQPRPARGDTVNAASGTFADESRDYVVCDYPRVVSDAYIAEDGDELPQQIDLNAVTFVGQAQQVVAAQMRDSRQGLRVTLTCNMRAYAVEPFDTLNVTLARFGWVNKPFEVLDVAWTVDGGIQLTMKETDASIWALGTSFAAADPAPNTLFPAQRQVPAVTGITLASGTAQLLKLADGTIVPRIRVGWDVPTDGLVRQGGGVQIKYGPGLADESTWKVVDVPGGVGPAYLADSVADGRIYMVKVRAYNDLVAGAWSLPVTHYVIGKTAVPAVPSSFTASVTKGRVQWVWLPSTDEDYAATEVRAADADWGSVAVPPLWRGAGNGWQEVVAATGTLTRYVRHFDTSGNASASAAVASQVVTAADLVQDGVNGTNGANGADGAPGLNSATVTLFKRSSTTPATPSAAVTYTFATAVAGGLSNGWTQTVPAGTDPLWVTVASAVSSGSYDTINPAEWASPVVLARDGANGTNGSNGSNGADGAPGLNSATVYLFQRTGTADVPALPAGTVVYTFASGAASGAVGAWSQSLPATGGSYRWVITATAASTGTYDNIASSEWAAPVLLSDATGALASLNTVSTSVIDANAVTELYVSAVTDGPVNFSNVT